MTTINGQPIAVMGGKFAEQAAFLRDVARTMNLQQATAEQRQDAQKLFDAADVCENLSKKCFAMLRQREWQ